MKILLKNTLILILLSILMILQNLKAQTQGLNTEKSMIKGGSFSHPSGGGIWDIDSVNLSKINKQNKTNPSQYLPYNLPNGWKVSPVGMQYGLDDLPLNLVVSPSKKYLGILNCGQSTQSLEIFSPFQKRIISRIKVSKSWYGLAFNQAEDKIYVSGGYDNMVRVYSFKNQKLSLVDSLILLEPMGKLKICPTGIALNEAKNELYVVTKEDNSLYIFDLKSKSILQKVSLPAEAFSCKYNKVNQKLYVSIWGGKSIAEFDIQTRNLTKLIKVGDHPNDFIINKAGNTLFVTNANDNTVSRVDLKKGKIIETLNTTLYPTSLSGSTPDGLTLSEDEKTLYIACADNNCLAVFDVSTPGNSHSKGFIPTGWYPTQVKFLGNALYVTNGKGIHSLANAYGPDEISSSVGNRLHKGHNRREQYIGGLFQGVISVIPVPEPIQLKKWTSWVYKNSPYNPAKEKTALGIKNNPIPEIIGKGSPIKYVFYIIKENRTYDQVLGDMKEGNGDSALCFFPEKITPNQHALARNFVLLDNFYVDAEVSADGHNWSTAAYATDYVEKQWPTSYSDRGGDYDYEGTRPIGRPKDGHIWNHLEKQGISFRDYGEFTDEWKINIPVLIPHLCRKYPSFDLSIPDSTKERIWEHDFDSLLAIGKLPNFTSIQMGNDHTSGTSRGTISILSAIADNDLGVGQLVEHISKSSIWNQSAIFILEDDAQGGSDHVDAHRSTAYLAGGFVKRHAVIHDLYTTSGMLRTIELILGMKPMSQYDAGALPMFNCFSSIPDPSPFTCIPAQYNTRIRNTAYNDGVRKSELMDFTHADRAPDKELNEIIWKALKGDNVPMPEPRHSAYVFYELKKKGEIDKD